MLVAVLVCVCIVCGSFSSARSSKQRQATRKTLQSSDRAASLQLGSAENHNNANRLRWRGRAAVYLGWHIVSTLP